MTILLYKDGRLVIDDGNPIEGNSLEGLVACVSDPQSGDTLKFDGKQWVAGAAASGLPAVSGSDNGKVLTVVEGAWAPAAGGGGGVLVVGVDADTGALDKTWQEIYDAGFCVVLLEEDENKMYLPVFWAFTRTDLVTGETEYCVKAYYFAEQVTNTFIATSTSGYPVLEQEG